MIQESHQFRVLVVDDEPDIRALLVPKLEKARYIAEACSDGEEALKRLTEERFDAVVTDLNMPKLNGLELVAKARASSLNPGLHIFVMSGAPEADALKKLAQLGIAEVVTKPFRFEFLQKRLADALSVSMERRKLPKQQFLDCFFKGTLEILQHYAQRNFEFGQPKSNSVASISGDVSASISFSGGGYVGFTSLILSRSLVDDLEEKLFGDSNVDIEPSLIADLVGEMINQIIGRAQQYLRSLEVEVVIGLPNVCVGQGHTLFQRSRIPIVFAPLMDGGKTMGHLEICVSALSPGSASGVYSQV